MPEILEHTADTLRLHDGDKPPTEGQDQDKKQTSRQYSPQQRSSCRWYSVADVFRRTTVKRPQ